MILLVRHGRTAANAAGLLLGRADPPLDDVGQAQAAALGRSLGPVDEVWCSPLQRTRDTAAAIDGPLQVDDRLIELDYGQWDEQPAASVAPHLWEHWQADVHFAPPGGESLAQVGERVRSLCAELVERAEDRTIVLVSHVSPIKAAIAWALDVPDTVAWRLFLSPASVTRLNVRDGRPQMLTFNETSHLPQ